MHEVVFDRCRGLQFFTAISPEAQKDLIDAGRWFSLPGGARLFEMGDEPADLFVVLAGRLIVVRERDGADDIVGYVRAGEPLGERALLAGDRHTASAYALRDTELLAVPRAAAQRLMHTHADLASLVARILARRVRHGGGHEARGAPRVFALVAASPSVDVDAAAAALAEGIERCGRRAVVRDSDDLEAAGRFEADERAGAVVLTPCRVGDNALYRFALRHADRFLVFTRRDSRPPTPFPLAVPEGAAARRFRLVDLVVLQEGQDDGSTTRWPRPRTRRGFSVGAARRMSRGSRARCRVGRWGLFSPAAARGPTPIWAQCAPFENAACRSISPLARLWGRSWRPASPWGGATKRASGGSARRLSKATPSGIMSCRWWP